MGYRVFWGRVAHMMFTRFSLVFSKKGTMKNMMYYILEREKLIVEVYEGEVRERELVAMKEKIFDDEKYDNSYYFISDFRNASPNLRTSTLKAFVDYLSLYFKDDYFRKVAVITSTPAQIASFTLFSELSSRLPLDKKVFCSMLSASLWLGLENSDSGFIEEIVTFLGDGELMVNNDCSKRLSNLFNLN